MEPQETLKSQRNPEDKKEQVWRYHAPGPQIILHATIIKQHGVGKSTHTETNGTESRSQK